MLSFESGIHFKRLFSSFTAKTRVEIAWWEADTSIEYIVSHNNYATLFIAAKKQIVCSINNWRWPNLEVLIDNLRGSNWLSAMIFVQIEYQLETYWNAPTVITEGKLGAFGWVSKIQPSRR